MSTSPESGSPESKLDLDLHFLPAWAQKPPAENKYAQYEGGPDDRPQRRGDRSDRREPGRDRPRRPDQPRGDRAAPSGDRPWTRRDMGGQPARPGRARIEERREAAPPIELNVSFIPEEKGVESLARQIRLTGRAYPLFDIACLILKKPDRYNVRFNVIKKPDGQIAQPIFVCGLDETLWLSEQEAIDHVLNKHFSTFYQAERTPTDPPKGTYTFVAQCGMSGAILGPPNYHDYQNKLRKLHNERFSRMPFDVFKSRIKIVRDEPIVKKWLEEQSWKTEFVCLNVPETIKLASRSEVEKHFRETHLPNVIKSVESHTLSGTAAQAQPLRSLQNLVRRAWEEQMRFPLKIVNVLSQQFAGHGLQFFKVNKTVTHVAVARPHYLDLEVTPVSEGIKRIVEFINATSKCSRRKLLEAFAPGAVPQAQSHGGEGAPPAEAAPPTPEAAAIISDLHWLIHQGHVIEFANGLLEMANKPIPRPPKPAPAAPPAAETQPQTDASGAAQNETAAKPETAETPSTETPQAAQETEKIGPTSDQLVDAEASASAATSDAVNADRLPEQKQVSAEGAAPVAQPAESSS
ncbi:MAG: hypothetical protein FJ403_17785 [Verrucomicrobia bacterium]|nr:hypothetical protein [Verrucomicrobiota bacterium]